MEKLIELLNEYEKKTYNKVERNEEKLFPRQEFIISKKFWFIQWLVENEKIDFEKKLNTLRFESLVNQTLDSYLALLMLLAIQDNPIEFLASILK